MDMPNEQDDSYICCKFLYRLVWLLAVTIKLHEANLSELRFAVSHLQTSTLAGIPRWGIYRCAKSYCQNLGGLTEGFYKLLFHQINVKIKKKIQICCCCDDIMRYFWKNPGGT